MLLSFVDKCNSKLTQCFSKLPFTLQRAAIEEVANRVLKMPLQDEELDFLSQSWLEIVIVDLELSYFFSVSQGRVVVVEHAEADITFAGNLNDFVLLATQTVDPDTLFFQRRLTITGDTELGLGIKNLIDSIEMDSLPIWFQQPIGIYAKLQTSS